MRDLVVDLRRLARRSGIETYSAPSTAPERAPTAAVPTATTRRTTRQIAYLCGGLALFAIALWLGREYGGQLGAPVGNAVAVLPFVNESGDPDDLHLSEGISDDLRARLMELPGWSVTARTSSVSFRNQDTDIPTFASSLQVTVLINGSLRRRGDRLNVLGEALDAKGRLLESWVWEGAERDFLALQQDIAADVRAFLAPETATAAVAKTAIPTAANESANMLVVMGEHFEREVRDQLYVDEAKLERAIDYYRRATAADPSSVAAHSRLARALVYRGDVDNAREPLAKALDLGESNRATTSAELSDLYYTSALYLLRTRSATGIEKAFQTSIGLNPNNAEALSTYAQWAGTHSDADTNHLFFREALRLDPLQLSRYTDYASALATREEMDGVRELASEIRTRFPNARGYVALARLYEMTGELDVGIAWGLKAYEIDPSDLDASRQVAELYTRIGELAKAEEFEPNLGIGQLWLRRDYEELIDEASDLMFTYPDDLEVQYFLAFALNANGDSRNAIRILEGAGMPIDPASESRTISEDQALTTYIDALQAVGGRENEARELAERKLAVARAYRWELVSQSWWWSSYEACSHAQLGDTAKALEALERIKSSQGLAWLPLLQDGLCFRRLSGEPRYQTVIAHLEARQAALRERLPATLREYGVADVRARGPR
jgi:TolB-like protein/Tfp pilus assembly protein PilF